jgi:hypothetical protein
MARSFRLTTHLNIGSRLIEPAFDTLKYGHQGSVALQRPPRHQVLAEAAIAAGLLIMAGGHDGKPLDFEALERWARVGFERGTRFRKGER